MSIVTTLKGTYRMNDVFLSINWECLAVCRRFFPINKFQVFAIINLLYSYWRNEHYVLCIYLYNIYIDICDKACHNQIDPYISYNIFVLVTYVQRPLFCFGATKFGCKVNVKINVNVMLMLNVNILSTISRSISISSSRWLLRAGLMDIIQCQILRWRQCFYLVSFIQILLRLCNIVYS